MNKHFVFNYDEVPQNVAIFMFLCVRLWSWGTMCFLIEKSCIMSRILGQDANIWTLEMWSISNAIVTWLWDTLPMEITTNEHNPRITWVSGSTGSAACGGEWSGPGGRESRNSGSTERSHQIFLNKIVNIKQFIKIYAHKFHENLCMSKSFPILSSHALLALAGVNKKPFAW